MWQTVTAMDCHVEVSREIQSAPSSGRGGEDRSDRCRQWYLCPIRRCRRVETHYPCFGGFSILVGTLSVLPVSAFIHPWLPRTPRRSPGKPASVGLALVLGIAQSLLSGEAAVTLKFYPVFKEDVNESKPAPKWVPCEPQDASVLCHFFMTRYDRPGTTCKEVTHLKTEPALKRKTQSTKASE